MDARKYARIEKRFRIIKTPKIIFFTKLVRCKFHEQSGVYESFMHILFEYTYARLDPDDMYLQVSRLFCAHPEVIKAFCRCFSQAMSTENDDEETPRPAKKAKTEDYNSKAATVFNPISNAYEAREKEIAQFIDGTLYVTETKTKHKDEPQAYEHLSELVNEIGAKRIDTCAIMDRASNLLQGYPELIETFNEFLPEGFRIVVLSDYYEMSTN